MSVSFGYLAAAVTNPGAFTAPNNCNDRNDATSATKSLTASGVQTVTAELRPTDYSGGGLGTVPMAFAIRVKHSCTTSGSPSLSKFLSVVIQYSTDNGASFIPTSISHTANNVALTFDEDVYFFVPTAADLSKLIINASMSIVSSALGSVTLNYTCTSIEIYPLFQAIGSIMGVM